MKPNRSRFVVLITGFLFLLQFGCEEQAAKQRELDSEWFQQMTRLTPQRSQPAAAATPRKGTPRITFEKVAHDFGNVSPATTHLCAFDFTNTGDGVLEIEEVERTCGCTPFALAKNKYAPGERGSLKVGFYSDTQLGSTTKPLYIYSNDQKNPALELAVKAKVVAQIDYEPKTLDLMLMQPNANCPAITIRSLDNQPFSIVSFESTDGSITADFNPSLKQRQLVLRPKVDMQKLQQNSNGSFIIGLSHPECKVISGTFSAPPRFSTSPRSIMMYQVDPRKTLTKKIHVISNYNEEFEIEEALSQENIIKVLNLRKIQKGYEFELEITPPVAKGKTRIFTDVFAMNIKGVGRIEIPCNGFYPGAKIPTRARRDKECKTCKPIIVNKG